MKSYDIRSIDFRYISDPDFLQDELIRVLKLSEFYGGNWDAFWNSISGITKMPSNFILYNINDYKKRYPEDAKKLLLLNSAFNKLNGNKKRIILDYTEELEGYNGKDNFNLIFKRRPFQFGLRGDPHLWTELEEYFANRPIPENEHQLIGQIYLAVEKLTGNSLDASKPFFVKKYNSGGMSSGRVSPSFWINGGIPLLIGRYRMIKKSW